MARKSFFGSQVVADHVLGVPPTRRSNALYALLNDPVVPNAVVAGACGRYGYAPEQVELRLYVGKFTGDKSGEHDHRIRAWVSGQTVGGGPIGIIGLREVATTARRVAASKICRDQPALVAIKVLESAGMLHDVTHT